jgi:RNA polymerase sigma-70 factor (ECF subfamily)
MQSLRYDPHQADDLLQGFLTDKVLEQRLIGHADARRGKFRTFILTALDRYVIDEHRRRSAKKRSPAAGTMDIDALRDTLPAPAADDTSAFDHAWAMQLVNDVLCEMRTQCELSERLDVWEVFEVRYLKPAIDGTPPEPHESIAQRLKLQSPHHAGNLLTTAKRMFTRLFKSAVSQYAADDGEVRSEVADLWRLFSGQRV